LQWRCGLRSSCGPCLEHLPCSSTSESLKPRYTRTRERPESPAS
jgi:hypothetical protein